MKRYIYNPLVLFILAFFALSCEKEKIPGHLEDNVMNPPVNLVYSETSAGFLDTIQTELPTWDGTTNVKFEIDTITSSDEEFNLFAFSKLVSIDNATGVITLSDKAPIELVGTYYFGVKVYYSGGLVTHDSASMIEIVELPFAINYEGQPTSFNFTHQGVMASPTITDLQDLTVEGYELVPEVPGISINEEGQIIKENNDTPDGDYAFEVVMTTDKGVKRFDSVYVTTVLPLNIDLTYEAQTVNFNYVGEIASPDISTVEDLDINDFTYSMTGTDGNAVEGLVIDENTGVISKTNYNTPPATHQLTVTVTTPIGDKIFADVMTVTVGERPELTYSGATQGGATLTTATLSPWSGMSASINVDVTTIGTDLEFSFLDNQFTGIAIDATTGVITVAEDSNIPEGTYPVNISILVKDHGLNEVMNYENVFNIVSSLEAGKAEEVLEDFMDDTTYPNNLKLEEDVNGFQNADFGDKAFTAVPFWQIRTQKGLKGAQGTVEGSKIPAGQDFASTALVKSIQIDADVRGLTVSFDEMYGYNESNADQTEKTLTYNYDQDIDAEIVESGWTTIPFTDGTSFSTTAGWGTGTLNNVKGALTAENMRSGRINIMIRFNLYAGAPAKNPWLVDNFEYTLYKKSEAVYE
ncbi:Ig domain-containing protein [Flammeovirga sp. OC4]|uniref:Ig domain-containing protein n=1 Tax=Flammeovirga sp. OC4 TaxID=1382345 RepID=UPI0005C7102C|nr:Ig domain-containing protein [Flammeovirga sp. OC4]